ncbi:MAG: hypothetical protein ACRCWO_13275 [Bosea sp. (in: a-proteobacteria)]
MRNLLIWAADTLAAKAKWLMLGLAAFWALLLLQMASGGAGPLALSMVALFGLLTIALAWALVAFWRRVFDLVEPDE